MMFKANPAFLGKLLKDPKLAQEMLPKGRAVLNEAKSTAPVDSGAYEDSLEMWVEVTDRVAIRVGSRDPNVPYAADINVKTGHLARALDAAERDS
jgi:hypothetical protein